MRRNPIMPLAASVRRCPTEWMAAASETIAVRRIEKAPRASTPRKLGPRTPPSYRTVRAMPTASIASSTVAITAAYSIRIWRSLCTSVLRAAVPRGMARRARIISVFGKASHGARVRVKCAELAIHECKEADGHCYPHRNIKSNRKLKREGVLDTEQGRKEHNAILKGENPYDCRERSTPVNHKEERPKHACKQERD